MFWIINTLRSLSLDIRGVQTGYWRDFKWESVLIITNYSLKAKLILLNNGLFNNICFSIYTRSDLSGIGKEAIKKTITLIDR